MSSEEVGRGRPPKHTRFKKGQSGNPKGRPKGSRNIKAELMEELKEPVTLRQQGKNKKMSSARAVFKTQKARALQGSDRAAAQLMGTAIKMGLHLEQHETTEQVDNQFKAIIERFRKRAREEALAEIRINETKAKERR